MSAWRLGWKYRGTRWAHSRIGCRHELLSVKSLLVSQRMAHQPDPDGCEIRRGPPYLGSVHFNAIALTVNSPATLQTISRD